MSSQPSVRPLIFGLPQQSLARVDRFSTCWVGDARFRKPMLPSRLTWAILLPTWFPGTPWC